MAVKRHPWDIVFSNIITSVGVCEAKGYAQRRCSHQLQTAHIVTRSRAATRTDLRNAFCLCFAHHRFFHDYPREFSRFITGTWAQEYYDTIYSKSITPTKVNWKDRHEWLKDIYKQIKNGTLTLKEARELDGKEA